MVVQEGGCAGKRFLLWSRADEQHVNECCSCAWQEQKAERDELYANRVALMPNFAAYQAKVTRTIPVVVLTRKA